MNFNLFTFNNPKTQKTKDNYLSIVLHLSPAKMSGKNFCPFSKIAGCEDSCLNTAGRGGIFKKSLNGEYEKTNVIQQARYRRSRLFIEQPDIFKKLLLADIKKFVGYCYVKGKKPAIRLNGTSDILWENQIFKDGKTVFELFPDVMFYDYTKIPSRKVEYIPNYKLIWSYSEANPVYHRKFLQAMRKYDNVAVVFHSIIPKTFKPKGVSTSWKVIDGDEHDLRFLDKKNTVIGLRAKGKAKKETNGFVIYA